MSQILKLTLIQIQKIRVQFVGNVEEAATSLNIGMLNVEYVLVVMAKGILTIRRIDSL